MTAHRFCLSLLLAAALLALGLDPARSQSAAPAPVVPQATGDAFGADVTMAEKDFVFMRGSGDWDKAYETIADALKAVYAFLDKQKIKPSGAPLTIFTATDDTGFLYETGVRIDEPLKNSPSGDIAIGKSPAGRALQFVHRGGYASIDNTYEAITNHLDEKRLEAKDMFVEEYRSDPAATTADAIVVDIYVPLK